MSRPEVPLKPFYYLDHFDEVTAFVARHYRDVLDAEVAAFLAEVSRLSEAARGLYVRMLNRKGHVFRRCDLSYAEIEEPELAWCELFEAGFAGELMEEDFADFMSGLSKPQLLEVLRAKGLAERGLSGKRRAEVLTVVLAGCGFEVGLREGVVVQRRREELEFVLYLYFGRLCRSLTDFTLRDLGLMQANRLGGVFQARFACHQEAKESYRYAKLLEQIPPMSMGEKVELARGVAGWPEGCAAEPRRLREKVLWLLGNELERAGEGEAALAVFAEAKEHPGTEKRVRLAYALKGAEAVEPLLERMMTAPGCDAELLFAEGFYERKFKRVRVGALSRMLRGAEVLLLDESGRDRVERAAVAWHERHGRQAWWVENELWRTLFGLLLWEALFGRRAILHNGFERLPPGLKNGTFYEEHREWIEAQLALVRGPERVKAELAAVIEAHRGEANGLFEWREPVLALVVEWVASVPDGPVVEVLRAMATSFRLHGNGFPDLLVREGDAWRFVEIKAPGDQLRQHQLAQLQLLKRVGFEVVVERVEWTVDPEQEYVVVDVETTGQSSAHGRVTEIGAVRVRGGRVVEEWQSLIQPMRHIPSFIARLTGIDDELVREAPRFEEIAAELRAFLGEAVFVAHNARFDYGFIRAEFARIGQAFWMPSLCTRVSMKRYFPGLPSYGLAALSSHLGIPLESHHRALCDARATAQLLLLINQRRREAADV